jgi:hypothetical protein
MFHKKCSTIFARSLIKNMQTLIEPVEISILKPDSLRLLLQDDLGRRGEIVMHSIIDNSKQVRTGTIKLIPVDHADYNPELGEHVLKRFATPFEMLCLMVMFTVDKSLESQWLGDSRPLIAAPPFEIDSLGLNQVYVGSREGRQNQKLPLRRIDHDPVISTRFRVLMVQL